MTAILEAPRRRHRAAGMSELQVHLAVVGHLRMRANRGVLFLHYPAGEVREERTAAKLKAMGTRAGVPDLLLTIDGRPYGLEIKTIDGRLSATQREMQREMQDAGWIIATAHGVDSAVAILMAWGAIK